MTDKKVSSTDPEYRNRDTDKDKSDRFTIDQKLRRFGFTVHSRPPGGEPLWRKGGRVMTQAEALHHCLSQMKKVETRG